jgi:L-2-hydroxyglutarate oxidase LhgO
MDIEEKVVEGLAQLGQMKLPDDYRKLGSVFVGGADDRKELRKEYQALKDLGIVDKYNLEWWDEDKVEKQHGVAAGFVAGIYFPDDAIVDSSKVSLIYLL